MKNILFFLGGIIIGLGLGALYLQDLGEQSIQSSGYRAEATYFVEVPNEMFEDFAMSLFNHLNEVRSIGYIMGTSQIVTIRADGECGDDAPLEAYLADYVDGNQFVCFMLRRLE